MIIDKNAKDELKFRKYLKGKWQFFDKCLAIIVNVQIKFKKIKKYYEEIFFKQINIIL